MFTSFTALSHSAHLRRQEEEKEEWLSNNKDL